MRKISFFVLITSLILFSSCFKRIVIRNQISNSRTTLNRKFVFDNEISKFGLTDGDTLVDIGFSNTIFDEIIHFYYPKMHFVLEDIKPRVNLDEYYKTNKNKQLVEFKNNTQIIKGSGKKIPLQSSKYKVLLCRGTIHEFKEKDLMISEMKRIIRDDGFIIIVEPRKIVNNQICGQGHNLMSEEEIIKLFSNHGMKLKSSEIIYRQNQINPSVIYKFYKN
jgi:hypothetical protein